MHVAEGHLSRDICTVIIHIAFFYGTCDILKNCSCTFIWWYDHFIWFKIS